MLTSKVSPSKQLLICSKKENKRGFLPYDSFILVPRREAVKISSSKNLVTFFTFSFLIIY